MDCDFVREVTEEEVQFFQTNGWVHLPGLVDEQVAAEMLTIAESAPRARKGFGGQLPHVEAHFSSYRGLADSDKTYRSFVFAPIMERNASRLLGHNKRVRFLSEGLLVKDPASDEDGHGETIYHQDLPYTAFDRTGTVTFWLALMNMEPRMGPMRFYSGSHRFGPLGMYLFEGADVTVEEPWLRELELSPPLTLKLGDATVHNDLVVHGAPPNTSDGPRYAYAVGYFDALTRFTGQPFRNLEALGLAYKDLFDRPDFPLLPLP